MSVPASCKVTRVKEHRTLDVAEAQRRKTVAERVNDERTLELVAEVGVDHAQGFYLGTPTPLE